MANEAEFHGGFANSHFQTCPLHNNEKSRTCSGYLKRGRPCVNKAIDSPRPGTLSMCKIHQSQVKISTFCRARLPCGFQCCQPCLWRPHHFQMCAEHCDHPRTCHFLKIPIELRLRIYRHLLPDKPIPALRQRLNDLRSDGQRLSMALLRVNRQIHDEAADVLYGARTFSIEVSANSLSMCNSPPNSRNLAFPCWQSPGAHPVGTHQLQDYQMQLMLLEQQNQRRLMMARASNLNGNLISAATANASTSAPPTLSAPQQHQIQQQQIQQQQLQQQRLQQHIQQIRQLQLQQPPKSQIDYTYTPAGPIWSPPLNTRYFNLITSFHVTIILSPPLPHTYPPPLYPSFPANASTTTTTTANSLPYTDTDILHTLIGRLLLLPRPPTTLTISLNFGNTYPQRSEAIHASQFLLRPFLRLSNITTPSVNSITMQSQAGPDRQEIDILSPFQVLPTYYADDIALSAFLTSWATDLSSAHPSLNPTPVFTAYWKLEKMIEEVKGHYGGGGAGLGLGRLGELLSTARVAREDGDQAAFEVAWEGVVEVWCEFLEQEKRWQESVAGEIDSIYGVVKGEEMNGFTDNFEVGLREGLGG